MGEFFNWFYKLFVAAHSFWFVFLFVCSFKWLIWLLISVCFFFFFHSLKNGLFFKLTGITPSTCYCCVTCFLYSSLLPVCLTGSSRILYLVCGALCSAHWHNKQNEVEESEQVRHGIHINSVWCVALRKCRYFFGSSFVLHKMEIKHHFPEYWLLRDNCATL